MIYSKRRLNKGQLNEIWFIPAAAAAAGAYGALTLKNNYDNLKKYGWDKFRWVNTPWGDGHDDKKPDSNPEKKPEKKPEAKTGSSTSSTDSQKKYKFPSNTVMQSADKPWDYSGHSLKQTRGNDGKLRNYLVDKNGNYVVGRNGHYLDDTDETPDGTRDWGKFLSKYKPKTTPVSKPTARQPESVIPQSSSQSSSQSSTQTASQTASQNQQKPSGYVQGKRLGTGTDGNYTHKDYSSWSKEHQQQFAKNNPNVYKQWMAGNTNIQAKQIRETFKGTNMIKERLLLSLVEQYGGIEPLVEELEQIAEQQASLSYSVKPHSASQVNQSYASQYQSKPLPAPKLPKPPTAPATTLPAPKLPKPPTAPAITQTQAPAPSQQPTQQAQSKPAVKPFGWNRYSNDALGRAQEQWDQDELETGIHHSPRPEAKPVSAPTFKPNAIPGMKATATGNVNLNQTSTTKHSVPKVGGGMKTPVRKQVARKKITPERKFTPKQIRQNIASSNKQVGQSMPGFDYSASLNPFAQADYTKEKYSTNTSKPKTQNQTWKNTKAKKIYGNT